MWIVLIAGTCITFTIRNGANVENETYQYGCIIDGRGCYLMPLANVKKPMSVTVWKDGTWKMWSCRDAEYARDDPDWLTEFSMKELLELAEAGGTDQFAARQGITV